VGIQKFGGQIFALVMLQFLATFEILLFGLSTTRKHYKSFSCNFWGSTYLFSYLYPTIICNFWHPGILTFRALSECPGVKNYKRLLKPMHYAALSSTATKMHYMVSMR